MSKVLVIDDEETCLLSIQHSLEKQGHEVSIARTGPEGLEYIEKDVFEIIISDIRLPGLDGIELLKKTKSSVNSSEVIMITAYGTVESAVESMKLGAYDYITKPFQMDELLLIVERLGKYKALENENLRLREEIRGRYGIGNIIGKSHVMQKVFELINVVAKNDITVLLQGDTGTGKEMVANAIHYLSGRRDKGLVKINLAAIPETLLESELFGHEKGAFSGAATSRLGKFEVASEGTIFLDEVCEAPISVQVKLLRVLQENVIERLGSNQTIDVDVRVISATKRDLKEEIEKGNFREDLYYRLNAFTITLPPLRERKDDIPVLADHFLEIYSKKSRKNIKGISPEALSLLMKYHFPGNVRELENIIERAVTISSDEIIQPEYLPQEVYQNIRFPILSYSTQPCLPLSEAVKDFERCYIQRALEIAGRKKAKAAELLQISRKSLWEKMREND